MAELVGRVFITINGIGVVTKNFNPDRNYNRKQVNAMTPEGKSAGWVDGVTEHKLTFSAVMPQVGVIDFDDLKGVVITVFGANKIARQQYLDCVTTKVGEKYTEGSEALIDVEMLAGDFKKFLL